MFMGTKPAILAEVRRLTQSQPESVPLRVAVAFWGQERKTWSIRSSAIG